MMRRARNIFSINLRETLELLWSIAGIHAVCHRKGLGYPLWVCLFDNACTCTGRRAQEGHTEVQKCTVPAPVVEGVECSTTRLQYWRKKALLILKLENREGSQFLANPVRYRILYQHFFSHVLRDSFYMRGTGHSNHSFSFVFHVLFVCQSRCCWRTGPFFICILLPWPDRVTPTVHNY